MVRALFDDVRLALRVLGKQPRFVAISALTLALGIGSVTAIFSVVNGVLLTPLPYPDPDRLTNVWSNAAGLSLDRFGLSPDLYYFFKDETHSFEEMALFKRRDASFVDAENPEVVTALETTASYFPTMGLRPDVGQVYGPAQDAQGAPLVAVISHRFWQRRFSGDRGVVGRNVKVDGETATIIGVLPAAIDDNGSADLWLPGRQDPKNPPTGSFGWSVSARLKPGATAASAEAEFPPLVKRLIDGMASAPDYRAFLSDGKYRVMVHVAREDVIGDLRQPLWILLGTVGFVMLIACSNVANLFLIRAEGRQKELAIRTALGATRPALVRKQLVEALVLAGCGGALGVGIAALSVPALIRAAPSTIPRLTAVSMNATVLGVAALTTFLAAIVFGIVPAFRYTRPATTEALRHGGRGATADRARHRGRRVLVVVQTAMTLILLVGSGLLVRSFSRMLHDDLGFNPADTLTFKVALPPSTYADRGRVVDFEQRLVERLAAVPGITAAGAAVSLPMTEGVQGRPFEIEGRPTPSGQLPPIMRFKATTPGYMQAIGMRVLSGRAIESRDMTPESHDVVINKVLADRFWPGADPLGKRLRPRGDSSTPWFTVVGVVSSERHDGFRKEPPVIIYFGTGSALDGPPVTRSLAYVLRGPGAVNAAAAARSAVQALDPHLPLAVVRTMDEIVSRSIVSFTFTMLTLGIAAMMALLLGMIGLYGVLSYTVTLRVREIGVRLALGAQPSYVMRGVVGQGLLIVAVGLVVGVGGAYGLTRFLSGLLYDTKALDVTTFAGMSLALFVVAALASYLPARRAASVSPLESLRSE